MSFCHHCGKEVQSDALFCSHCGTRQHVDFHKPAAAEVATAKVPTALPPIDLVPAAQPQTNPSSAHQAAGEPEVPIDEMIEVPAGGANRWPVAAIATSALVLVLLVVSLIVRIMSNSAPEPEGLPGVVSARPNAVSLNAAAPVVDNNAIPLDNESSLCQSNLRQIALSMLAYVQDNDGHYPPAKPVGSCIGWADIIQPYLKSTAPLRCPLMPPALSNSPSDPGYTDYYYNRSFDSRLVSDLSYPANTIMLGDGAPSDARYTRIDTEGAGSPPANTRHQSGANYGFADGHVKWLFPTMALPASAPVDKTAYSHNAG